MIASPRMDMRWLLEARSVICKADQVVRESHRKGTYKRIAAATERGDYETTKELLTEQFNVVLYILVGLQTTQQRVKNAIENENYWLDKEIAEKMRRYNLFFQGRLDNLMGMYRIQTAIETQEVNSGETK